MSKSSLGACHLCRFAHRNITGPTSTSLSCRRFPPQQHVVGVHPANGPRLFTDFPAVKTDWYCGEYEPSIAVEAP